MIFHRQYTINEYLKTIKNAYIIMNKNSIKKQILESIKTKEAIIENGLNYIEAAAEILIESINSSCKILWCGNGGCLLYTSPSPRDRTRSRMPSSA